MCINKFYCILIYILTLITSNIFSQEIIEVDSIKFPWYHPNINYIQFYNKSAIQNFKEALNQVDRNKVTILHLGDSHIQSEIPTGLTRQLLQKKYGEGGRGIVFPYSTAKTYSSIHYSSKHLGNWTYAKTLKLPAQQQIGIMGMSAKTYDSIASFSITFNSKLPTDFTEIKLYCEIDSLSYDIQFETDGKIIPVEIYSKNNDNKTGYVSFTVPSISNVVTIKCTKTNQYQNNFLFYGLEINSSEDKGIIYTSAGVGGSKFKGVLGIDHLNKHIKSINPDLVVLDFGTNDFLYDDSIKESLESEIKEIITKIRLASPLSSILLCNTQDLYYHQKNIQSCEKYSLLIQKIAKEFDCAFWDWFWISGGNEELKTWLNEGLARTDLIHLTNAGYKVKGKLFFDAIENTIDWLNKNPDNTKLLIDITYVKNLKKSEKPIIVTSNTTLPIFEESTEKTIASSKEVDQLKNTDTLNYINKSLTNSISKDSSLTKGINLDTISNNNISNYKNNDSITSISLTPKEDVKLTNIKIDTLSVKKNLDSINLSIHTKTNELDTLHIENTQKLPQPIFQNTTQLTKNANHDSKIANPYVKVISAEIVEFQELAIKNSGSKSRNSKIKTTSKMLNNNDTIIVQSVAIPKQLKPKNIYYKVKNGDNLSIIAEKYHVTVNEIKNWNRLKSINLSIGETLIIRR